MIFQHSSSDASRLHISIAADGERVLVALAGELDGLEAAKLADTVAEVTGHNPGKPIDIDAAGLTFLDSAGIKALLACRRHALNAGCRLTITTAGTIAYQVLQITGLLDTFNVPAPH